MSDWDFSNPATERVSAILAMKEALDDIQVMVTERKQKLEADGFSPTAAERMSMQLWIAALGGQG